MYLVIVMVLLSFLTTGAWKILQQKNCIEQAVFLEYNAMKRQELLEAGAAYMTSFFVSKLRGAQQLQALSNEYTVRTSYKEYSFLGEYKNITPEGAVVTVSVVDNAGVRVQGDYTIAIMAGHALCTLL